MSNQSNPTPLLSPDQWRTFLIWQYDWRNEPINPAKLQRQIDEVSAARPDAVFRGWFKWASDLDYAAMSQVVSTLAERGIGFIGGLTCAALTEGENGIDAATFADLTTRDAHGDIPRFGESKEISHFSWANPKVVDYLVDCAARQIQAGAQALHLDEIWVLGSGATAIPNEGFDDYALAAFRRYLKERFPDYSAADWKTEFDIDDIDSFDYRTYLQNHYTDGVAWAENPDASLFENPLAPIWKTPFLKDEKVHHEWFQPDATRSFHEWSMLDFSRRLLSGIRAAAKAIGKQVALAHNGPWPDVDFQNWNVAAMPEGSREAVHRPLQERWRHYRAMADQWSGAHTPAVVFIDWPGELPVWLQWPRDRQETCLRTTPFEARMDGVHFAYHWRNFWPGSDAIENGLAPLIESHCRWFTEHRRLFPEDATPVDVRTNAPEVRAQAFQTSDGTLIVQLLNFQMDGDSVRPIDDLHIHFPELRELGSACFHGPESEGGHQSSLKTTGATLHLPQLRAFGVVESER